MGASQSAPASRMIPGDGQFSVEPSARTPIEPFTSISNNVAII